MNRVARLALAALTLLASGCATTHVAGMELYPDGHVEFVLAESSSGLDMSPKSDPLFSIDESVTAHRRVALRKERPTTVTSIPAPWSPGMGMALPETLPREGHVPAELGLPRAVTALPGDGLRWLVWASEAGEVTHIEARAAQDGQPRVVLSLEGRQASNAYVIPLLHRRAVVVAAETIWLLDAEAGTTALIAEGSDRGLRGATSEGDLLLFHAGSPDTLRLADGTLIPMEKAAVGVVSTPGALWMADREPGGPLRFDRNQRSWLRFEPVPDHPRLLGVDGEGWLWFDADTTVDAGEPLPLVRWEPSTGRSEVVALPTR